jgi:ABC-type glycerol-3-phosphate transport system substrate-binding protein
MRYACLSNDSQSPTNFSACASGLLGWYGNLMQNATKAMGTSLAVEAGMGKGEYSGLMANLRAGMVVFGPYLFGSIAYPLGQNVGMPGMPFVFIAAVLALAEVYHQKSKSALKAKKAREAS